MLKVWSLTNFKSFKDRTEIELAPITVLAGANSSGKSTIIQSILLLKQTLQYVPVSRAIGLNGPLLKLGRFDDVRNIGSTDSTIEFAWELDDISNYRPPGIAAPPYFYGFSTSTEITSARFSISFGVDSADPTENQDGGMLRGSSELRQLQPTLHSVNASVSYTYEAEGKRGSTRADARLRRPTARRETIWPAPGSEDTRFGVTMGPEVGHGASEVYAGVQA